MSDKIKDRIKKLLALQKSAEEIGSLEEAQNAAAQVAKLLIKYNIELSDIEGEEKTVLREGLRVHEIIPFNKTHGKWLQALYSTVSKHNFCKSLNWKTQNPNEVVLEIWGENHNVEIVKELAFNYAMQIIQLEKERWEQYKNHGEKRNSFRRGYYIGAVNGLHTALKEVVNQAVNEGGENALMVINNNQIMLKEAINQVHNNIGNSRRTSYSASIAGAIGREDGKNLKKQRRLDNKRLLE